jgi:hypothetical protein
LRDLSLEEAADGLATVVETRDEVAAAAHPCLAGVAQRVFEDTALVVDGLVHDGAVQGVDVGQRALVFKVGDGARRQDADRAATLVSDLQQVQLPLEIRGHWQGHDPDPPGLYASRRILLVIPLKVFAACFDQAHGFVPVAGVECLPADITGLGECLAPLKFPEFPGTPKVALEIGVVLGELHALAHGVIERPTHPGCLPSPTRSCCAG